jgi:tyrosyl-tRNA synthetase
MFGFKKKATVNTDEKAIDLLLSRGVDEVIGGDELKKRMLAGEQLRVKLGIDPTSPNLHLGRSIPLLKLRDFQQMGHQVVFIVGDFTGTIGDTSDKDSERPMLTKEQVKENLANYKSQVSKLIDFSSAEIHYNSKWLEKLSFSDISELASVFSVNQFISRELISKRLEEGKRVSLHETMYPIMQGYDSVAIKADVELGGTDQRFNMLAGRDLQKHFGLKEQSIVTSPIIEGTDGRKMSSSWGNTINFTDTPSDMFGKIMSVNDELVLKYFELLTRVDNLDELKSLQQSDPKKAKQELALEIVKTYHSEKEADQAKTDWEKTFSQGGVPEDVKEIAASLGEKLIDVFIENSLLSSKTEFRRRYEAGAIKNAETGEVAPEEVSETIILKYGKKNFVKIVKK